MEFKKRFKKGLFWLLGIFIVMFLFRMAYGFAQYPSESSVQGSQAFNTRWDRSDNFFNIASSKYEFKNKKSSNTQMVQVDQKYEKTANLECKSNAFEEDEKTIRGIIKDKNAIIQFQQNSGNKGNRQIHLQIGVPPEMFDPFINEIKTTQRLLSFNMTKKDKTNEYRELNSKRKTLESTRKSLLELKSKGGKIEEFVQLENRILEIDEQLQALGVQLGNFDSENEFCTVNISLIEGKISKISFIQRVKVALQWTIEYYLMLMIAFAFALGGMYLLIVIIDKLKVLAKFK